MPQALLGFLTNSRVGYFVYEAMVIRVNVVLESLGEGLQFGACWTRLYPPLASLLEHKCNVFSLSTLVELKR